MPTPHPKQTSSTQQHGNDNAPSSAPTASPGNIPTNLNKPPTTPPAPPNKPPSPTEASIAEAHPSASTFPGLGTANRRLNVGHSGVVMPPRNIKVRTNASAERIMTGQIGNASIMRAPTIAPDNHIGALIERPIAFTPSLVGDLGGLLPGVSAATVGPDLRNKNIPLIPTSILQRLGTLTPHGVRNSFQRLARGAARINSSRPSRNNRINRE